MCLPVTPIFTDAFAKRKRCNINETMKTKSSASMQNMVFLGCNNFDRHRCVVV